MENKKSYLQQYKETKDSLAHLKRFIRTIEYKGYSTKEKEMVKKHISGLKSDLDFFDRNIKWF